MQREAHSRRRARTGGNAKEPSRARARARRSAGHAPADTARTRCSALYLSAHAVAQDVARYKFAPARSHEMHGAIPSRARVRARGSEGGVPADALASDATQNAVPRTRSRQMQRKKNYRRRARTECNAQYRSAHAAAARSSAGHAPADALAPDATRNTVPRTRSRQMQRKISSRRRARTDATRNIVPRTPARRMQRGIRSR